MASVLLTPFSDWVVTKLTPPRGTPGNLWGRLAVWNTLRYLGANQGFNQFRMDVNELVHLVPDHICKFFIAHSGDIRGRAVNVLQESSDHGEGKKRRSTPGRRLIKMPLPSRRHKAC